MNIKYAYSLALLLSLTSGYSCGMEEENTLQIPENWSAMKEGEKIDFAQSKVADNRQVVSLLNELDKKNKKNKNDKNVINFSLSDCYGRKDGSLVVETNASTDILDQTPKSPLWGYIGPALGSMLGLAAYTTIGQKFFNMIGFTPSTGMAFTSILGIAAGGFMTGGEVMKPYYKTLFWRSMAGFAIIRIMNEPRVIEQAQRVPVFGQWVHEFGSDPVVRNYISLGIYANLLPQIKIFERYGSFYLNNYVLTKIPVIKGFFSKAPYPKDRKEITFLYRADQADILRAGIGGTTRMHITRAIPNPDSPV